MSTQPDYPHANFTLLVRVCPQTTLQMLYRMLLLGQASLPCTSHRDNCALKVPLQQSVVPPIEELLWLRHVHEPARIRRRAVVLPLPALRQGQKECYPHTVRQAACHHCIKHPPFSLSLSLPPFSGLWVCCEGSTGLLVAWGACTTLHSTHPSKPTSSGCSPTTLCPFGRHASPSVAALRLPPPHSANSNHCHSSRWSHNVVHRIPSHTPDPPHPLPGNHNTAGNDGGKIPHTSRTARCGSGAKLTPHPQPCPMVASCHRVSHPQHPQYPCRDCKDVSRRHSREQAI